jgi:hypothetical protein
MPKNLINFGDLDPAVAAAMGRGDRRQADARLPKDERARVAKQREKDSHRRRFNMDLDEDLDRRLAALASEYSCPASGLANLAIALFLDAYDQDSIDMRIYLAPSNSPRYDRTIKLPSRKINKSPPRGSP